MALKAITVNTAASEPAHILAEDDAAIYEALIGDDRVLDIGGKLAATVISNNKVRITDGVVVVGGHVARIYKGDYEDMTIENGVSGKNRNDLIVARFITGSDGGADSFKLVVIKGTAGTTASDPATVKGNLYDGDKQRDYPLWRVKIEGLSITKVEQLYEIGVTNADLSNSISQLKANIKTDAISLGNYDIPAGDMESISVNYTPPSGYKVAGFSINYPSRYTGGIRYRDNTFEGTLYNISNNSGSYGVTVLLILMKE